MLKLVLLRQGNAPTSAYSAGSAILGQAEALCDQSFASFAGRTEQDCAGGTPSSCQLRQELQCPSQLIGDLWVPQYQNQGLLLASKPTLLVLEVVMWTEGRSQESS